MFQEENDDSTCALCDIYRYVFNELTEPQNYIDSIDDVNKKIRFVSIFLIRFYFNSNRIMSNC